MSNLRSMPSLPQCGNEIGLLSGRHCGLQISFWFKIHLLKVIIVIYFPLYKFKVNLKPVYFYKICIYGLKPHKIWCCSVFLVSWKCVKIAGKSYG